MGEIDQLVEPDHGEHESEADELDNGDPPRQWSGGREGEAETGGHGESDSIEGGEDTTGPQCAHPTSRASGGPGEAAGVEGSQTYTSAAETVRGSAAASAG